jgi:hypothetical protein
MWQKVALIIFEEVKYNFTDSFILWDYGWVDVVNWVSDLTWIYRSHLLIIIQMCLSSSPDEV